MVRREPDVSKGHFAVVFRVEGYKAVWVGEILTFLRDILPSSSESSVIKSCGLERA
jgi:hypothetical protein